MVVVVVVVGVGGPEVYLGPCQTPLMKLFDRVPNALISKSERNLKFLKYEEVVLTTVDAPAQMFGEGGRENFSIALLIFLPWSLSIALL